MVPENDGNAFSLFFLLAVVIIVGGIIYVIINTLKDSTAKEIKTQATLLKKRKVNGMSHNGGTGFNTPTFSLTFQFPDGTQRSFAVNRRTYQAFNKGDSGLLSYQRKRFNAFFVCRSEDNKLEIAGKTLEFPQTIAEIKLTQECLVIRLAFTLNSPEQIPDEECNVYAVNYEGTIVWQIKNDIPITLPEFTPAPIVLLFLDDQENLFVTDFLGRRFAVDKQTGAMKFIGVVK